MQIGYAQQDITPRPGLTLSGFAARNEQPSTGIADRLAVRVLALKAAGVAPTLLVSFDLLALGRVLTERLHAALDEAVPAIPRPHRILCCTHTHSAPAAIRLIRCGRPVSAYWDLLVRATVAAVGEAVSRLRPAAFRYAVGTAPDPHYNRRRVLDDGRVVMTLQPRRPIRHCGPTDDRLLVVRFEDTAGHGLAGIVAWAAHPITRCTQEVSADFPGALCRELTAQAGMPFLFLQGAAGNANPRDICQTDAAATRRVVESLSAVYRDVSWSPPSTDVAWGLRSADVPLAYAPVPPEADGRAFQEGMERMVATGEGPASVMAVLGNVLNVEPGQTADPAMMRHIARALAEWCAEARAARATGLPAARALALHALRLNDLALCFIAAEPFAETGVTLQRQFPSLVVATIGYAAPLVGYLPTDAALAEGGYEVEFAYRFYGHPAPFAPGSEPAVVAALARMIRELMKE